MEMLHSEAQGHQIIAAAGGIGHRELHLGENPSHSAPLRSCVGLPKPS